MLNGQRRETSFPTRESRPALTRSYRLDTEFSHGAARSSDGPTTSPRNGPDRVACRREKHRKDSVPAFSSFMINYRIDSRGFPIPTATKSNCGSRCRGTSNTRRSEYRPRERDAAQPPQSLRVTGLAPECGGRSPCRRRLAPSSALPADPLSRHRSATRNRRQTADSPAKTSTTRRCA